MVFPYMLFFEQEGDHPDVVAELYRVVRAEINGQGKPSLFVRVSRVTSNAIAVVGYDHVITVMKEEFAQEAKRYEAL